MENRGVEGLRIDKMGMGCGEVGGHEGLHRLFMNPERAVESETRNRKP